MLYSAVGFGIYLAFLIPLQAIALTSCPGGEIEYSLEVDQTQVSKPSVRLTQATKGIARSTWQMDDPDGLISLALLSKSLQYDDQVHRAPFVTSYLSSLTKLHERLPSSSPQKSQIAKLIKKILDREGSKKAKLTDEVLREFREEIYPIFKNRQIFVTLQSPGQAELTSTGSLESRIPIGFFESDFSRGTCQIITSSIADQRRGTRSTNIQGQGNVK